jgi:hypothetical protein
MMVVMLIAGIGCLLAGLAAIGFGIPVKEFSFGNTLILTGAIAGCTGLVMLGLWCVVRELQAIAERLGGGMRVDGEEVALLPTPMPAPPRPGEREGFLFGRDQSLAEQESRAEPDLHPDLHPTMTSRDEALPTPEAAEAPPVPKPRRNLMFSSTSRRERERAQTRAADQSTTAAGISPQEAEAGEPAGGAFGDTRPKSDRARFADAAAARRGGRAPSTFNEPNTEAGENEDQSPVTVLKSGVVDGMAYSLYSDGSIEAQMPEGMMRFASIDELRAHLDQRP